MPRYRKIEAIYAARDPYRGCSARKRAPLRPSPFPSPFYGLCLSDDANLVQFNHTIGAINAHNRRVEPLENRYKTVRAIPTPSRRRRRSIEMRRYMTERTQNRVNDAIAAGEVYTLR